MFSKAFCVRVVKAQAEYAVVKSGDCGHKVQGWPCDIRDPSSIPGSRLRLHSSSLTHTSGVSSGVVPRK